MPKDLGKNNLEEFEHRLEAKFSKMTVVETGNNNTSLQEVKCRSKFAVFPNLYENLSFGDN